jgi:DNA-directed RNA polymerase specialized sigma24 family protein
MEIEDEILNPNETEEELVHRLTRRITRSALDRFRRARRRSSTASITLEPIQEHPTPSPPPPASSSLPATTVQPLLCHQDFFNDFSGKLYFSDDVELKKDDLIESINE